MLTIAYVGLSLISGLMGCLLIILTLFFEKNKKRARILLIWACLFLAASFATTESAFWYEGYNIFELVLNLGMPLIVYFGIWFAFIIWIFEARKERKTWIILFILLVITVLIAMNCMDCIRF